MNNDIELLQKMFNNDFTPGGDHVELDSIYCTPLEASEGRAMTEEEIRKMFPPYLADRIINAMHE